MARSVADNRRFGSGNKVLHNIVGGAIGVLEGNGGDLRVGLPMQSLHNGRAWMHEPLRLLRARLDESVERRTESENHGQSHAKRGRPMSLHEGASSGHSPR